MVELDFLLYHPAFYFSSLGTNWRLKSGETKWEFGFGARARWGHWICSRTGSLYPCAESSRFLANGFPFKLLQMPIAAP